MYTNLRIQQSHSKVFNQKKKRKYSKKSWTRMFIIAFPITSKNWKRPICPSTGGLIKGHGIFIQWNTIHQFTKTNSNYWYKQQHEWISRTMSKRSQCILHDSIYWSSRMTQVLTTQIKAVVVQEGWKSTGWESH